MTLPANSTFLPVLDDLLSPDFRPVLLPVQTPQTPSEHAFAMSAAGPTCKVNFGDNQHTLAVGSEIKSKSGPDNAKINRRDPIKGDSQAAATKIQRWWKLRRRRNMSNGTAIVDVTAERAKHAIRHTRTEDHIRFLESEVNRLKGALSAERKLRSLQLEAIRSLWSQVQKFSSSASTDLANSSSSTLMTQSVPNGLPNQYVQNFSPTKDSAVMSMSLNSALDQQKQPSPCKPATTTAAGTCTCTKEIQSLRESLTSDMTHLRSMIDQLRVKSDQNDESNHGNGNSSGSEENARISQQKRPLSLNLVGISTKDKIDKEGHYTGDKQPERKEVSGYADQMASKLLEDAVEIDSEPKQ